MGTVQLTGSHRYPNILINRCVPVLFVAICFLIIANTRCDQVGSANGIQTQYYRPSSEMIMAKRAPSKEDPLSFLREIYLDQDTRIITILPDKDKVQKFHPNGRYGRSLSKAPSAHFELGKLASYSDGRPSSGKHSSNDNMYQYKNNDLAADTKRLATDLDAITSIDYQLEMSKLLKCSYTGVSNLYWCDVGN